MQMTKQELERLPALYRKLKQLNNDIENMKSSEIVTDSVKGGVAVNGKGQTISLIGLGHPKLDVKITKYRIRLAECQELIDEAEEWIDSLPEDTIEQMDIKTIMRYKYINDYTLEEIGDAMGYSLSGINMKIRRYWKCANKTNLDEV